MEHSKHGTGTTSIVVHHKLGGKTSGISRKYAARPFWDSIDSLGLNHLLVRVNCLNVVAYLRLDESRLVDPSALHIRQKWRAIYDPSNVGTNQQ